MRTVSYKLTTFTKSFAEKYNFILLLMFCIFILISPLIIRQNLTIPGDDSYCTLRIAQTIQDKGLISLDELSYAGREIVGFPAFPFIMVLLNNLFNNMEISFTVLNIILGILTFLTFYILAKLLLKDQDKKVLIIASLIFILSPSFLFLFTGYTELGFAFFLVLLGMLLFYKKSYWATLPFLLLPFFSVISTILVIIFLLFYWSTGKSNSRLVTSIIFLQLILLIVDYGKIFFNYGMPERLNFEIASLSTVILSDFGGKFGVSIFTLFAALIGFLELWERKYKSLYVYLFVVIIIFMSVVFNSTLIYLNIFFVLLAAFGFIRLLKQKWNSDFIKTLTIITLACGILFSGVSYINQHASELPNSETIYTINFINNFAMDGNVVLSHYSNGNWISYFSGKPNFMDSNFAYAPGVNNRYHESNVIFQSRDARIVKDLLDKNNISFIYITPKMKEGLVWDSDNQGLLFVFENSNLFTRRYNINQTEIWEYNKKL